MPVTLTKKNVKNFIIRNNDHFLTNCGQKQFGCSLCVGQHREHGMVALSLASQSTIERENVSQPPRQLPMDDRLHPEEAKMEIMKRSSGRH